MKLQRVEYTRHSLFDQKLLERLTPGNILLLVDNKLSPFSDYYGALVATEAFLRFFGTYQWASPQVAEEYRQQAQSQLLANIFVPNYATFRGKLNDRIRGLLQREEGIASSQSLERLVEEVPERRKRILGARKAGHTSAEKKQMQQHFEMYIDKIVDAAELLQAYLFALRPQIQPEGMLNPRLIPAMKEFLSRLDDPQYETYQQQVQHGLAQTHLHGKPIPEASFRYKGEKYVSTKAFVKDWGKVISLTEQLDGIKESPWKGRTSQRSWWRTLMRSAAAAALVVGIAAGGTVLVPPFEVDIPFMEDRTVKYSASWKLKVGFPVTAEQHLQILLFNDNLKSLSDVIKAYREEGTFDEKEQMYWLSAGALRETILGIRKESLLRDQYRRAFSLLDGDFGGKILSNGPSTEEGLEVLFDNNYVKKGPHYVRVENTDMPKNAALHHLGTLLNGAIVQPEEEEQQLLEAVRDHDIFFVVQEKTQGKNVVYLAAQGKTKIKYTLQQGTEGYVIEGIEVTK